MKKIILILCITLSGMHYRAQDDWTKLRPSQTLEYGVAKLIAKKNAVYVFNSNFSSLLKSTDYGTTWTSLVIPSDSSHHEYTDVTFVDDQLGFVTGYDGSLFSGAGIVSVIKKTTDGGVTWQKVSNGITNDFILTNISFFNHLQGTVFGTSKMKTSRFATDDGGLNWTYLPNFGPDMPQINSVDFFGRTGFAAGIGHYMHIAITHDEGSTWETKHFHNSSSVNGLQFFDAQNGIVIANDSIFTTSDGLVSFSSRTKFPYSVCIRSFVMLDINHGYFCNENAIYYTADGGATWSLSYSNPEVQLASLTVEGNYVFASTYGTNLILRLDVSDKMVGITENQANVQNELRVYPNPARDLVYISTLNNERLMSVTIIDQLGRIVKEQNLEGTKPVQLNELSPGAYVLEIKSEKATHTHKLVVQPK